MNFFRKFGYLIFALILVLYIGGCTVKGISLQNGWLEFRGHEASLTRPGTHANIFYLNWGNDFAWAKYDAKEQTLKVESARFGYPDGSWDEFRYIDWQVASPDFKTFLVYQGRGITFYRKPNSNKPEIKMIDIKYERGAGWMWVDSAFTQAIIPLSRSTDFDQDDVFNFGGNLLILFHIDLIKGTYTESPMDHFADSYLGPNFILWRHYTHDNVKGAKPSHFTATGFNMVEQDLPLVRLLNRYNDSLPDFQGQFKISSQGWALMGVRSPKTNTEIFLIDPTDKGRILPLFEMGGIPLPDMSRCAISEDGQYFSFLTYDPIKFPEAKGWLVHLGRVEKIDGHFIARITRVGDFVDLANGPPVWIPGTHALTVVTDAIEYPSAIRIYDLDKHPVDWTKVPNATPVER